MNEQRRTVRRIKKEWPAFCSLMGDDFVQEIASAMKIR
jgi:hypothetical protein